MARLEEFAVPSAGMHGRQPVACIMMWVAPRNPCRLLLRNPLAATYAGERSLESVRLSCTATVSGGHQRQYTSSVCPCAGGGRGGMMRAVSVLLVETGGLGGGKTVAAPLPATASHSQPNLPSILEIPRRREGNTSSRTSSSGVFSCPCSMSQAKVPHPFGISQRPGKAKSSTVSQYVVLEVCTGNIWTRSGSLPSACQGPTIRGFGKDFTDIQKYIVHLVLGE